MTDFKYSVLSASRRLYVLNKFSLLSPVQRRTLLAAWVCLPFFWLALRILGLPRLHTWLHRSLIVIQPSGSFALDAIRAQAEAVNIAARHSPFPATCLSRSLLLSWLLRRRNVASKLCIGVRLTHGALEAHAWVECDGVPVNDLPDIAAQFASFGDLVPLAAFHTV